MKVLLAIIALILFVCGLADLVNGAGADNMLQLLGCVKVITAYVIVHDLEG